MDFIRIRGAKQHNLKNIDVDIPRNKFIVITGVSGSGKSSLAFDTIFAEGQRRYVESLSTYARQFLELMDKPDVESIEGLSPSIAIQQKSSSHNPRSTVGTTTEIYDYLRLLYSTIGKPYCPECNIPIEALSLQQIVDYIKSKGTGKIIEIYSPVVEGRKGEYLKLFEQISKDGFSKVKVDGLLYDIEDIPELEKYKKHTIEVFIDKIKLKEDIDRRLFDSVEVGLRTGKGKVILVIEGKEEILSEKHSCPKCNFSFGEISPRLFSFNSPYGACNTCSGLGFLRKISIDRLIPDKNISIEDGCIVLYGPESEAWKLKQIKQLADHFKISLKTPWKDLPDFFKKIVLYGSTKKYPFLWVAENETHSYRGRFEGIIPNLQRRYVETSSPSSRQEIEQFMAFEKCPECGGKRLKKQALSIFIEKFSIAEISSLSIEELINFFENLKLNEREEKISEKILKEIKERLGFLKDVGLSYLTLDRASHTLSGGEAQRIRLATQVGSKLTGVLYVLDEPSIGLHPRDNGKLLETLKKLRDLGNTVIVVEHDTETILSSDYIIDLGPGAGERGGYVVATGSFKEISENKNSITGLYLSGRLKSLERNERRKGNGKFLRIVGAKENNLKNINVDFPLGTFICITGVSGSGKSTLIEEVLYKNVLWKNYRGGEKGGECDGIYGLENVQRIIDIDQSPIGRTPRSNPATYTGLFTPIREIMAKTEEARIRGYKPGRFSFNVKGGRCEACGGDGSVKIEMHFLPDVYVTCDVCRGKRYNRETLEVKFKGLSIWDILNLTVDEAFEIFKNHPSIIRILETLKAVGLGYIKLGQPAPTLSGGEAQRIKLSKELSKTQKGSTLYLLDEPTVGLHSDDVKKLLIVLHQLVDKGNTVIVIEHNLDVIKTADWIIDLGPEGGENGGYVVAEGTPEDIILEKNSYTGQYLKKVLKYCK